MSSKLFILALTAFASAAPFAQTSDPCRSAEFSLAMEVGGNYVPLVAIDDGEPNQLSIVADLSCSNPGTPVYQNGSSPNAQLNFNIDSTNDPFTTATGVYHISVPDVGEVYGLAVDITASSLYTYPHFYVNQTIQPLRTAAPQIWYACNATIQGQDHVSLAWGLMNSNGSNPYGCEPTSVIQRFNIACDA